jgi:hypothetical protein
VSALEADASAAACHRHRDAGVESAGNISVPEDAPAVLAQGQSSDASDARKYFQDLQQALAELPWIAHVLHYFFETEKKNLEKLASPDAFKAVEYYIHQITSPRENRIVLSNETIEIAEQIFESIQQLMLHTIAGDSRQEDFADVRDVINLVVKHLFKGTGRRVHEWTWDRTFKQIRTGNTKEVIQKTEEFFSMTISSCVVAGELGGLPAKSFGIFFRLPSWLVRLVLFIFKHNTAIQYRLMDHGYRSFVQLNCHVCPDGGVTSQDPVLLHAGGKEVATGEEQVHYSIICGYNIGECPAWLRDGIAFVGHSITQEHRDIVEKLSREYHQRFETYLKEGEGRGADAGHSEEEEEEMEEEEEETEKKGGEAVSVHIEVTKKRIESEVVGAVVEGAGSVQCHTYVQTSEDEGKEEEEEDKKGEGTEKETDSLSYEHKEQSSSLETVPFESQDSASPFRDLDT